MSRVALLLLLAWSAASGQDSSFSRLRLRAGVLRLPVVGHIGDDWTPGTGAQIDVASNVGRSEVTLGVGRVGFDPISGKPPFTETMISLSWAMPVFTRRSIEVVSGARLTDVRMHFDDPTMVAGLQNEEEQLFSVLSRARISLSERYAAFIEAAYGMLMTSTRTPTMSVVVGIQRDGAMPGWLRGFLR